MSWEQDLRHPRKEYAALTLKPGERRKLLGGHCECFEKQALDLSSLDIIFKCKTRLLFLSKQIGKDLLPNKRLRSKKSNR